MSHRLFRLFIFLLVTAALLALAATLELAVYRVVTSGGWAGSRA
jgi:hypothetical protein